MIPGETLARSERLFLLEILIGHQGRLKEAMVHLHWPLGQYGGRLSAYSYEREMEVSSCPSSLVWSNRARVVDLWDGQTLTTQTLRVAMQRLESG